MVIGRVKTQDENISDFDVEVEWFYIEIEYYGRDVGAIFTFKTTSVISILVFIFFILPSYVRTLILKSQ